jgi:hypothetical protein
LQEASSFSFWGDHRFEALTICAIIGGVSSGRRGDSRGEIEPLELTRQSHRL